MDRVKCKFSNFQYLPMQQQKSNSTKAMIAQKGIIDTFNICNNCKIWICCSHIIICCECSESFCPNCVRKEVYIDIIEWNEVVINFIVNIY